MTSSADLLSPAQTAVAALWPSTLTAIQADLTCYAVDRAADALLPHALRQHPGATVFAAELAAEEAADESPPTSLYGTDLGELIEEGLYQECVAAAATSLLASPLIVVWVQASAGTTADAHRFL